MRIIIDRFDGEYTVVELENGSYIDVSKKLFPDAKEGDIVDIAVNKEATDAKKNDIESRFDKLKR